MKTLKIILLAILLIPIINATAQDQVQQEKFSFGLKVGLNVSDITPTNEKRFNNTSSKNGLHAGITLDYAFTRSWYLLTGLSYTVKGVKIDNSGRELDIMAAYMSLPVYAGVKFPLKNDAKFLIYFGPYFAYGLHGNSYYGNMKYETFNDIYKNFDFGIGLGVGIEWSKLVFTIGGETGATNIMQENNTEALSTNFTLSVGYKF